MWNIKIENNVKIENKLEYKVHKAYAVIFKELFPSLTQNRIKEHPEYNTIINYILKLMDTIYQPTHDNIQETDPYLSLT